MKNEMRIQPSNSKVAMTHLLEGLFTRFIGSLIHDNIILCPWEVLVHVRIKGTLFNMRDRYKVA